MLMGVVVRRDVDGFVVEEPRRGCKRGCREVEWSVEKRPGCSGRENDEGGSRGYI
jgi:hypothetical protein